MITFYFQLLVPVFIMFYNEPRKEKFALRLGLSLGITLLLSALYYTPELLFFANGFLQNMIYFLTGYAFAVIVVMTSFATQRIKAAYLLILSALIQNFSHHLFQFTMRLLSIPVGEEYNSFNGLLILTSIYLIVYVVFFYAVDKVKLRDVTYIPKASLIVGVLFLLVMIVFGVYVRHEQLAFLGNQVAIGYEIYSVTLSLLFIIILLSFFSIGKIRDHEEELELRIDRAKWYYEVAHTNVESLRKLKHDMKHLIVALKNIEDKQEREEALLEMEEIVNRYSTVFKTGNEALDCILTEKAAYCNVKGISLNVVADGSILKGLRFIDIYVLFGNALDNAIESVLKSDEKENRAIQIKMSRKNSMAFIRIENWCRSGVQFSQDGFPLTTKTGLGHGYGVRSIQDIVEKYGGTLGVKAVDNLFTLDILLPIET